MGLKKNSTCWGLTIYFKYFNNVALLNKKGSHKVFWRLINIIPIDNSEGFQAILFLEVTNTIGEIIQE